MRHWSESEIALFVSGGLPPEEFRLAVCHLLHCRPCQRRLAPYAEGLTPEWHVAPDLASLPAAPGARLFYEKALSGAIAHALREAPRWRKEASQKERYRELAAARGAEALLSRTASWAQVEVLLELSFAERYRNPGLMFRLAVAAQLAAEDLDLRVYGAAMVADLKARIAAQLANAFRVREEYDGASMALNRADELWEQGTQNPVTEASILEVDASLASAERNLPDALKLLDRALQIYLELGETHLAGRVCISKGINVHYDGCAETGVKWIQRGLSLVERERDPRLVTVGYQALISALVDLTKYREAAKLLIESGLGKAFAEDSLNRAKLRWVEGKIWAGLGRRERAEAIFADVEARFRAKGLRYEASLVGLELAGVWADAGRFAEAQEVALEVCDTFGQLGLHCEALRAVEFFSEACCCETATAILARQVVRFLERLEWSPHLRFAPATKPR